MSEIARLAVEIDDVTPRVARVVEVPIDIRLDDLHFVLQIAIGWQNCHPFEFRAGEADPDSKSWGLLDRDDPGKVIGRLREPLLKPNENEREGYVPNVVYTCGALVHNGVLIIPYGLADHSTGFATVPLAEVLAAMQSE